jgi:dimethylaniline monooxygenase (N-oxide forming)
MREEWNLLPAGSMSYQHPVVQEEFIPALRRGAITPVKGFQDFAGENEVRLADGTVVEVDAVIFCTGYEFDFSIMPELEMDGACGMPLRTAKDSRRAANTESGKEKEPAIPRLFQMMFPPHRADSIAFISWMSPQENRWSVSELCAMAITQIWAAEDAKRSGEGTRPEGYRAPALLPSVEEMNAQVDEHHAWFRGEWRRDQSMSSGFFRGHEIYRFLHGAAGTGLYENIDHPFSTRGWALWWNDRDLWTWLAKGPMNCHSWRLLDTNPLGVPGCGRKAWPDARKTVHEAVSPLVCPACLFRLIANIDVE